MSRTAQVLSGTKPISFTTQLPLTFRGGAPVPNIALNFAGKPGVGERNAEPDPDHVSGPGPGAGGERRDFRADRSL